MSNNILTKKQIDFIKFVASNDYLNRTFYLSGGTAINAFYIPYRLSDDLDFFSELEFDPQQVVYHIDKAKKQLKIEKIDYNQSLNRNIFFLHYNEKEEVKAEFTYYPFSPIYKPSNFMGIKVDSLTDIGANKIHTIYSNPRCRDFLDLYQIIKKENTPFESLLDLCQQKFGVKLDVIQLSAQLLECKNLKDYPNLLTEIDNKVWQNFFLEVISKLKSRYITK